MIETILFDLDGTIVDTNELILQTFMHVLKDKPVRLPALAREHMIPHMGKPLDEQFRIFTGEQDVEPCVAAYRVYNKQIHDEYVREFPYVRETMDKLHRHGIKLGVVTTKMRPSTMVALERYDLTPLLSAIVTLDDVQHPKPHPQPVLTAIERLQAKPETTMMVGDSPADIESANRAGAISVGVAWSLKGASFLQQYGPKHIIHDMRDLLKLSGLE